MYLLCINTALANTEIALLKGNKFISENSWLSQKDEAEKLMPNIDQLLKNEKISFIDLKKIFVISGPGSFTGLRVGLSVANSISRLLNIPIYHLNTFEYLFNNFKEPDENFDQTAAILFAGRKGVYLKRIIKGSPEDDVAILNLDNLYEFLKEKNIKYVFGEITPEQQEFLKDIPYKKLNQSFGKTCEKIFTENKLSPEKNILPLYVKSPDITMSKKNI